MVFGTLCMTNFESQVLAQLEQVDMMISKNN